MTSDIWDYVIVGGGTAGCVMAARLSENPANKVLMLEAGGEDNDLRFAVPGGQLLVGRWDRYAWHYPVRPDSSRLGYEDNWRRGKALGGSSMINGLIFARGLPSDYDLWSANGCPGWSYADVLPAFKRLERYLPGGDQRGEDGPLPVEKFASPHALVGDLVAAFQSNGAQIVDDINSLDPYKAGPVVGETQTNQRRGVRQSAARAYLKPIRHRANLRVMTHVRATRLQIEAGRVVSVLAELGEEPRTFAVAREVILCAGPIASPVILMHSGIGPAKHLRALGLPVTADRGGVGQNLQEHPELYLEYAIDQPSYISGARPTGMLMSGLQYLLTRRGPVTSPGSHLLAYMKSAPIVSEPDLLFFAGPWGALEDTFKSGRREEVFSLSPSVARPKSRGSIALAGPDPHTMPRIDANLLGHPDDVALLIKGVRLADKIAKSQPFTAHVTRSLQDVDLSSDQELEAFVRSRASICYHACGTCRMGNDANAVVDTKLRLKGIAGVRVVDASVIPTVPSGNTMAPVFMIAERAAEFIRAEN